MKKLVTLLLSLVMLCALAMPAMAAEPMYSITINGAVVGHTYTAYQVFKGVYYKEDGAAGKEYLSDVQWGDGVNGADILDELRTNETLKSKFESVDSAEKAAYALQTMKDKSEELDEFARVVGNHLTGTSAGTTGAVTADTEVKINDLIAGYYFVKDTGTINAGEIATKFLVEVVGNAKVTVKAQAPEFEKQIVKENGDTANGTSANVGDTVKFRLTAKVPDMASFDKYTFTMHDTLSKGLTFNNDSVKVTVGDTTVSADKYTLTYPTAKDSKDTFTIAFSETQLKDLVKHTGGTGEETDFGATIVVEYTATLNKDALENRKLYNSNAEDGAETNTAYLEYSNSPSNTGAGTTSKTPDAPVYVYNFDIFVHKYDGTANDGNKNKKLEGAVFVLYKSENGEKKYYKLNEKNEVEWVTEAQKDSAKQMTTNTDGCTAFNGLQEGTYFLEEIEAPKGYNKLTKPVQVEIKAFYNGNGTLDSTKSSDLACARDTGYSKEVYIANKAGAVLPSTGGIGTTIFYVLGSILVLGAAVLLIVKKRMKDQER